MHGEYVLATICTKRKLLCTETVKAYLQTEILNS